MGGSASSHVEVGDLKVADAGALEQTQQAIIDLCAETMKIVEEKAHSEGNRFKQGVSIAAICEVQARSLFATGNDTDGHGLNTRSSADTDSTLPEPVAAAVRGWCENLDGR